MRHTLVHLEESKIREVANAGMGRPDVLAFWFGESDEATPDVVNEAAIASLRAGETFYSQNLGLPALREAIAAYMARLHGPAIDAGRIAVTSGGVSGLMLAVQALVDPGDEVVAVTPVWPNLVAQPRILGARLQCLPLRPREDGAWALDMDALKRAVTPATRLLVVNAPNNPTGWTLSAAEQREILEHCRATGTWILADEVYERLYYEPTPHGCAPSFLDLAASQDRLVVVHSFSKSFLMTGWRLGWLVLPPALAAHMGKLIEFNTSCVSVFTQRGGIAALQHEGKSSRASPPTCACAATPCCRCCRRRPACMPMRPAVACTPSSAWTATATRWPPPSARCGGRPGAGARQCLRPGRGGLAALVLRLARPRAAGGRGGAPAEMARKGRRGIIPGFCMVQDARRRPFQPAAQVKTWGRSLATRDARRLRHSRKNQ